MNRLEMIAPLRPLILPKMSIKEANRLLKSFGKIMTGTEVFELRQKCSKIGQFWRIKLREVEVLTAFVAEGGAHLLERLLVVQQGRSDGRQVVGAELIGEDQVAASGADIGGNNAAVASEQLGQFGRCPRPDSRCTDCTERTVVRRPSFDAVQRSCRIDEFETNLAAGLYVAFQHGHHVESNAIVAAVVTGGGVNVTLGAGFAFEDDRRQIGPRTGVQFIAAGANCQPRAGAGRRRRWARSERRPLNGRRPTPRRLFKQQQDEQKEMQRRRMQQPPPA
jgi:hypothetical protein